MIFSAVLAFKTTLCSLHTSLRIFWIKLLLMRVQIVSNFMQGEMMSDHFTVLFDLHIPSRPRWERIIKFRKVKENDVSSFATDLWEAFIPLTFPDLDELSKLVDGYNQVVASV